jgi:riboflavin kinase / FMN adenylyltransferase
LSIGNYDGVHRGHASIIEKMKELATRPDADAAGIAVVTFEPHPLTKLRPHLAPPRLTPAAVKRRLLEALGVTHLVELPPTPDVLGLEAERFWQILRDDVRPGHIVEGPNFNFGKNRGGNVRKLMEWSAGSGVGVHEAAPREVALLDRTLVEVSSTLVRFLIAHGRVRDAAACLGRPYALVGEVVRGEQRGRAMGMPTANLDVKDQLVPGDGVYAGRVTLADRTYAAGVSVGTNPTFDGVRRTVEAHLIGFAGDLYGQVIELEIVDWLRDQRRFFGVGPLMEQMKKDLEMCSLLSLSR